jgi:hypothetical protein
MPMRAMLNKLISIFRIELQDLEEDINDLLAILERRRDSQEITTYVYLENKGVLLNEIACVKELVGKIGAVDANRYGSVDDLIAAIRELLKERIKECAFPEAVHSLVQRKFEKVCSYVMGPEGSRH